MSSLAILMCLQAMRHETPSELTICAVHGFTRCLLFFAAVTFLQLQKMNAGRPGKCTQSWCCGYMISVLSMQHRDIYAHCICVRLVTSACIHCRLAMQLQQGNSVTLWRNHSCNILWRGLLLPASKLQQTLVYTSGVHQLSIAKSITKALRLYGALYSVHDKQSR